MSSDQQSPADAQGMLRWLARTQNMDGSWNSDVEWTAAALLAFTRARHTTRRGTYRQVVGRAARWLVEHAGQGPVSFLRARALKELAAATGSPADHSAAEAASRSLSMPSSMVELAALEFSEARAPEEISTLDDLRAAALLRVVKKVPAHFLTGEQADLARIWLVVMQPA